MDPNVGNQGEVPPPETPSEQPGQATQYFPPQTEYSSQGPAPSRPQDAPSGYTPPADSGAPVYPPVGQPAPMYPSYGPHVTRNERDRTLLALILIAGGVLFLLDQTGMFAFRGFGDLVLLVIGGVFLYAYFNTRPGYRIGFLIPGAILLGIGAGQVVSDVPFVRNWLGGDISALFLGLGFCLIWLLERRHWWALIPGGILVLAGLGGLVGSLWPLGLVALGVYLLYDQSRRRPVR